MAAKETPDNILIEELFEAPPPQTTPENQEVLAGPPTQTPPRPVVRPRSDRIPAREAFAAFALGQNPHVIRANQEHQRQALELEKQQADRQALVTGIKLFNDVLQHPKGPLRKFGLQKVNQLLAQLGGQPMDPEFLKLAETAGDEEAALIGQGLLSILQGNAEMGVKELSQALAARPDLVLEQMNNVLKSFKQSQEAQDAAAKREILNRAFPEDSLERESNTLTPQSGQRGQVTPQPGRRAAQEPPAGIKQVIVDTAEEFGVDPNLALAVAQVESGFNPQAQSPTGVVGLFQVTNATGARFGQTPQTRTDPRVSARAGIAYLAELLRFTNGNVELALRHYNGPVESGGDPQYVQKVLESYQGEFPVSQTVKEAPPEFVKRLNQIDVALEQLETTRKRLLPGSGDPEINAILDNLDKHLIGLRAERKDLLDRFKPPVTQDLAEFAFTETGKRIEDLSAPQRKQLREQMEARKEARDIRTQRARGAAQTETDLIGADAARKIARKDVGVGTTKAQIAAMERAEPGSTRPFEDPPNETIKTLADVRSTVVGIDTLIDSIEQDPNLASIVGSIFSDPEAAFQRAMGGKFKGYTSPEQRAFIARLTVVAADFRRASAGLAQTAHETSLLKPAVPTPNDVDMESVLTKLHVLREGMSNRHAAILGDLQHQEFRTPAALPARKPKGTKQAEKQADKDQQLLERFDRLIQKAQ